MRPRRTGITSLHSFLNFPTHIPMFLLRTVLGPWQVRDYYIHGEDVINHVIPQAQNVKWLSQDHTQESKVRGGTHICFLYMISRLQKPLPQRQSQPHPPLGFHLMGRPMHKWAILIMLFGLFLSYKLSLRSPVVQILRKNLICLIYLEFRMNVCLKTWLEMDAFLADNAKQSLGLKINRVLR